MVTGTRQATARIDDFAIQRVEVTNFGEPQRYYVTGEIVAKGEISLPDRTTLDLRTRLTMEEHAILLSLCDAIGERVLRELSEGLR